MPDRIDIHDPISEICVRLGLDPHTVSRLEVTPSSLVAEVFLLNESGSKYIDEWTNAVVTGIKTFEVTT